MNSDKAVKLQQLRERVAERMKARGQSYDRRLTMQRASSPEKMKVRFDWSKLEFDVEAYWRAQACFVAALSVARSGGCISFVAPLVNRANYYLTGAYFGGQSQAFLDQFWEDNQ